MIIAIELCEADLDVVVGAVNLLASMRSMSADDRREEEEFQIADELDDEAATAARIRCYLETVLLNCRETETSDWEDV